VPSLLRLPVSIFPGFGRRIGCANSMMRPNRYLAPKERLSCYSRASAGTMKALQTNTYLSLFFPPNFTTSTKTTRMTSSSMHCITIQQRPTAGTRLLQLTLLLIFIFDIVNANPVCDGDRYGRPDPGDCRVALTQFPQDKNIRYFVEQPLRSKPPQAL